MLEAQVANLTSAVAILSQNIEVANTKVGPTHLLILTLNLTGSSCYVKSSVLTVILVSLNSEAANTRDN